MAQISGPKEANTLQNYAKQLQQQNKAKTLEIQTLRQQLTSQSSSRAPHGSTISLNCTNCKNKQQQIANLNKSLKETRDNYQMQIRKLKSNSTVQKIVYKEVQNQTQAIELQRITKKYEQLKIKFEEAQKVEWSRLRIDGSESLTQQNLTLKNQNNSQRSRIEFLEKRLVAVQQANRVLREELIVLNQNKQSLRSNIRLGQRVSSPPSRLATFRYFSPPKQGPIQVASYPRPVALYNMSSSVPLSPLSVLNYRGNNQNSIYQSSFDYSKDIVQQKWKSLQYKIKILEAENGKLRQQVNTFAY